MLLNVIALRTLDGLQRDLEFENGERRRFDMRPLLTMKPWNRIKKQPSRLRLLRCKTSFQ